jgi:predicted nucleic acid binding AN1-type Zn finger protein
MDSVEPIKKATCKLTTCQQRPVKIVGHCRYCSNDYCAKHRFVEAHHCEKMQECRDASKEVLANKLMTEKCSSQKVQG